MYITNQNPKYYIWDFRKRKIFKTFNSKTDFLIFIAKQFRGYSVITFIDKADYKIEQEVDNWVLKRCVCSINDSNTACRNTTYQILDNQGRILSPIDIKEEAIKLWEKNYRDPLVNAAREQKAWTKGQRKKCSKFRNSPIPRTGKHWFSWRIGFRAPKTTAMKRYCCAPDQQKYNRGSWKYLPSVYDDIIRTEERNWKSQSKRRHQWKPKK